jgi:hypothetical protein
MTAAIVLGLAAPVIAQGVPADQNARTSQATAAHSQELNQAPPGDKERQSTAIDWPRVGIGFTTAVGNLFYIPAKLAYGTLGSVAGGAAYVFSRQDHHAARQIWRNSLGGDYVLTPEMLTGREPIHFMGTAPKSQALEALPNVSQPEKTPPESFAAATGADGGRRAEPPANPGYGSSSTLEIPNQDRLEHPDLSEQEIPPSQAYSRDSEKLPQMSIERQ